jgi:putative oxidoreductase
VSNYRGSDLAQLILRLGVGGALVAHGTQKLFGWFGGGGLDATSAAFDRIGFKPGRWNALAAGLGEAGGGAALALGLATPAASATVVGTMAVASSTHLPNGFFAQKGGYELPSFFGLTAAAVALGGPGRYSIDHLTGHCLDRSWMRAVAFSAAIPAAVTIIARRQRALAAHKADEVARAAAETPMEA